MKIPRLRKGWLPLTALGLLLAAALLLFYARSRDYDASSYFANLALLRHLKQLDASWELNVMKSRVGLNQNYDALVDPLPDVATLPQQLAVLQQNAPEPLQKKLEQVLRAFQQAMTEKARLIEAFKSHNAILRNSLAFLPMAATDAGAELPEKTASSRAQSELSSAVNAVLLATLVYTEAPAPEHMVNVRTELEALLDFRSRQSGESLLKLDIFLAHVRTVLREHAQVSQLLLQIAQAPTAAHLDEINNLLTQQQQHAAGEAHMHRLYLLLFSAGLAALLLYAAIRLLRSHRIINRINHALQHANEHLERRVRLRTQELEQAQSQLVAAARQAGMAEIATNVLHNVGNVLNSVGVSVSLLVRQARDSRAPGLSKAVQLINKQGAQWVDFLRGDERGQRLPAYLDELAGALGAERQNALAELNSLSSSIDHIKDIIATQQSYAGAACLLEDCSLDHLLEEALGMSGLAGQQDGIAIMRDYHALPPLRLDRHRVLQILINLLGNARRAMDGLAAGERRLILRLRQSADDSVQLQVADSGEGIPAENLARIFSHGFTTRKDGHGFGLHSCVLAAREMGGSLQAASDGPGTGATFTLQLPIHSSAKDCTP
ncbi:DAHL domain-containing protein [Pseudoduganella violacea]|uniref:histidine kinase n=1 Tax=Pseudoduganella violacea TaxID=1715466 RepID=A0A7W5FU33_9BURK|nr:DAHL domain-containing protein [Pseudoduganella violacea]MBB3119510.1 signal transduction histidine kinase [Pseudoduganella violacea]